MGADQTAPTLLRLLRLWRLYAYMDLVFTARDFRQALTYWGSDLILNVAAVTATLLLAERFQGIGPWGKHQVVFMLGYTIVARGILDTFLNYNVLYISRRLGRGQLDHTLIQPQPVWLALLTEGFTPISGSGVLLPGLGLMLWAGWRLALPVTPGWLAALAANLVASATVVLAFSYLWGSLAFWAPRAAEEVSTSALRLVENLRSFPLDGLAPVLLGGLLTAVPAGFVGWYPCRALLGLDPSPFALALTPAAALAFGALATLSFRKGLEHHARIGSQRYLSFGHRR